MPIKDVNSLKIIVVSSQASNSGSNLRARYIADGLEKCGARVSFVNGVPAMPFMLDYLLSLILYLRIIFIPCDVIIGLKPYPNVSIPMMIKKLFGKVTVIDIDDVDFGYRGGFISKLNSAMQKPFPKHFDMITYHTPLLKNFIKSSFGVETDKMYQLKQGVNTDIYYPVEEKNFKDDFIKEHGIEGKKILVYTAHLNIASDLESIFEIVLEASLSYEDFVFLIIGGGPMYGYFKEKAKTMRIDDMCIFTGYLKPKDVARHLMLGDAAIVYYRDVEVNYYRESMKLREMLAMGLPVVSNDVGDLKNFEPYCYQSGTGYKETATKLAQLLNDGGDGREEKGKEYIRSKLNWENIARDFNEELKKLCGSR